MSIPITAPKGLLKILILDLASRTPSNGIGIAGQISALTAGTWTPSPGSIYYVLGNLVKGEYLTEIYTSDLGTKRYVTTSKGKALLVLEREKLGMSLRRSIIFASILARLINSKLTLKIADVLDPISDELGSQS